MFRSIAFAVVLMLALPAAAQPALLTAAPTPEDALTPRQAEILNALRSEPGVSDVQIVRADASVLHLDEPVLVSLPNGPAVLVQADAVERRAAGISWRGTSGEAGRGTPTDGARASFVVRDGLVTGVIRDGTAVYTLRPLTGGLHVIARVDPSAIRESTDDSVPVPKGAAPAEPPAPAEQPDGDAATLAPGAAPVVDILIVYTKDVTTAYADPAAFAQLGIDSINETFANSNITMRVALSAAYETQTPASSSSFDDLAALTRNGDGRFDEVHALREQYGADLVAMLGRAAYEGGICGVGYLDADAASAFTVTCHAFAVSNYSLAHEVGHNFGATHDPYVRPTLAYPYGQGTVDLAGRWLTVMAYHDQCTQNNVNCTTIPYWSSPSVIYQDTSPPVRTGPTGTAAQRDNRRVLNERAATVAAFRTGTPAAALATSLTSLEVSLAPGEATTRTFTIRNTAATGSRPLNWSARISGVGPNVGDECVEGIQLNQPKTSFIMTASAGSSEFGQGITSPCTGRIRLIAPYLRPSVVSWDGTLRVYAGTGTRGSIIGEEPVAYPSTDSSIPFYLNVPLEPGVAVTRGSLYTWFLDLTTGRVNIVYSIDNPYSGGTLYMTENGNPVSAIPRAAEDMTFYATFGPPTRWTSPVPNSGRTAAGMESTVTLQINSAGLSPGRHDLALVLSSNAPASPTTIPLTLVIGTVANEDAHEAAALALDPPRPNPARGASEVSFSMPEAGLVRLSVVDLLGREVAVIAEGEQAAGRHVETLDTGALAPGVYVVRLSSGAQTATQRVVVVR